MTDAAAEAEARTQSHADRVKKNGPIQNYSAGSGVEVSVWNRLGRRGDYKQVTIKHSFKSGDDKNSYSVSIPNEAPG